MFSKCVFVFYSIVVIALNTLFHWKNMLFALLNAFFYLSQQQWVKRRKNCRQLVGFMSPSLTRLHSFLDSAPNNLIWFFFAFFIFRFFCSSNHGMNYSFVFFYDFSVIIVVFLFTVFYLSVFFSTFFDLVMFQAKNWPILRQIFVLRCLVLYIL